MTLLGTVDRVRRGTFCFLKTPDGTEYHAHRDNFLDPDIMKPKQLVKFTPVEIKIPGRRPEAMNVEAA